MKLFKQEKEFALYFGLILLIITGVSKLVALVPQKNRGYASLLVLAVIWLTFAIGNLNARIHKGKK